jgi:hypothetical protein
MLLKRRSQLLDSEWLREKRVCAKLDNGRAVAVIGRHGHHGHAQPRLLDSPTSQDCPTIHLRHGQIKQHHVGQVVLQAAQRRGAVRDALDDPAIPFEGQLEQRTNIRVVLDDQDMPF